MAVCVCVSSEAREARVSMCMHTYLSNNERAKSMNGQMVTLLACSSGKVQEFDIWPSVVTCLRCNSSIASNLHKGKITILQSSHHSLCTKREAFQ